MLRSPAVPSLRLPLRPPRHRRPLPHITARTRSLFTHNRRPVGRAREELNVRRLVQDQDDYHRNRHNFLLAGAIAGIISTIYTAWKLKKAIDNKPPAQLDSALPPTDPIVAGVNRKVVVHDKEGREVVPTGNSVVEFFPRTIDLPDFDQDAKSTGTTPLPAAKSTEYTLVGLGTRSVTFIGINVYVVGYYVATADIAALQSRLVKRINPIATTLVAGEKDELRRLLLDPAEGEALWDAILREGVPARSAFRIVPVRDTDFHHLRDGFVRAIQARSDKLLDAGAEADKDAFGDSMRAFRQVFNRGKVPKSKELLLMREDGGRLRVVYNDGSSTESIGNVDYERISRALWLNWLAGKNVASEPARKSIAEGLVEFVERPVGTVAAQVV